MITSLLILLCFFALLAAVTFGCVAVELRKSHPLSAVEKEIVRKALILYENRLTDQILTALHDLYSSCADAQKNNP
jgi:hypothetical protein